MEMKFDPVTGEPIQSENNEEVKTEATSNEGAVNEAASNENDVTEATSNEGIVNQAISTEAFASEFANETASTFNSVDITPVPKKKSKAPLFIGIAAVIIAIIVGIFAFAKTGLSREEKLAKACANTFKAPKLLENLNYISTVAGGKCTIESSFNTDVVDFNFLFAIEEGKEFFAKGNVSAQGIEVNTMFDVTEEEMLLTVPELVNKTFRYGIGEEKNGYLIDLIESEDINLDEVDDVIKSFFDKKLEDNVTDAAENAATEISKLIELKDAEAKEFEVNGSMVKCKGYLVEYDEELLSNIIDIYKEYMENIYSGYNDIFDRANVNIGEVYDEMFDEMKEDVEGVEGTVSFYIYKNQLVKVVVESDEAEMVVSFECGDMPWPNTTIEVDGREIMTIAGKLEGTVESYEIVIEDYVISYTYDYEDGSLESTILNDDESIEMVGSVIKKGDNVDIVIDKLTVEDSEIGGIAISVRKGAEIDSISKDEVFDIGTATEEDLMNLIQEMYESDLFQMISYFL